MKDTLHIKDLTSGFEKNIVQGSEDIDAYPNELYCSNNSEVIVSSKSRELGKHLKVCEISNTDEWNDLALARNVEMKKLRAQTLPKVFNLGIQSQHMEASIIISPPSSRILFLGLEGSEFVSYFEKNVSKSLAFYKNSTNYFSKTYVAIAEHEEVLMNALAAWGGMFIDRINSTTNFSKYLAKVKGSMHKPFSYKKGIPNISIMRYLCLNCILMGFYICLGDTCCWFLMFRNCVKLVESVGGVGALFELFDYSNDIKFLVSNLHYHDVMKSSALLTGTTFQIKNYEALFRDSESSRYSKYGLDPIMGPLRSLCFVLGDIMDSIILINDEEKILKRELQSCSEISTYDDPSLERCEYLKTNFYAFVESIESELHDKIEQCTVQCLEAQLDKDELEFQTNLFNLFSKVCWLYWFMYIKRYPPVSHSVQNLKSEAFILLRKLISSGFVIGLSLPLIVTGITCISDLDKKAIIYMFSKVSEICPVNNIERAKAIVEHSWMLNPNGLICINWGYICATYGWEFCAS